MSKQPLFKPGELVVRKKELTTKMVVVEAMQMASGRWYYSLKTMDTGEHKSDFEFALISAFRTWEAMI